jgi:gamma-glutamyltranspeptidase/glutathione hydrolase
VVSAHPDASQAGLSVLQQGGNAADAAIAMQWVLSVVEPQSSGIGGGGFAVVWARGKAWAFDGRETAPGGATPDLFIEDGAPMSFERARADARSVGVPAQVHLLFAMHQQLGRLSWPTLLEPAIRAAEDGFVVGMRLNALLQNDPLLRSDPEARRLYYQADGTALAPGTRVRNPELAWVLKRIANLGPAAVTQGPVAQALLRRIGAGQPEGSTMTAEDLQAYSVRITPALCFVWQALPTAQVCGMPPPSSGTLAVGQMLGMLESLPESLRSDRPGPLWAHVQSEVARLAFADRAAWVGDPKEVAPPAGDWRSLLDEAYLRQRASAVGELRMPRAIAGHPRGAHLSWAEMTEQVEYGTTHLNAIDDQGMAVAMTSSIESAFGSRRMVNSGQGRAGGFLLNHELTDFSLSPTDALGRQVANAPGPGKRPRSSMTPLLVVSSSANPCCEPQVQMALGSAGGPFIIHHVTQTLWALARWNQGPQEAILLPRWGITDAMGPIWLEADTEAQHWVTPLRERGHPVRVRELSSGVHLLARDPKGRWQAGIDPRREGLALGD